MILLLATKRILSSILLISKKADLPFVTIMTSLVAPMIGHWWKVESTGIITGTYLVSASKPPYLSKHNTQP